MHLKARVVITSACCFHSKQYIAVHSRDTPKVAAMKKLAVLCVLMAAVTAQYRSGDKVYQKAPEYPDIPIPYSFSYVSRGGGGGSSGHQESGDGNGRIQGSYSVSGVDGRKRVVEYVADEDGFRAVVKTNELGTANLNPSNVIVESSAAVGAFPPGSNPDLVPRPQLPGRARGPQGVRYVLVPITHPRARGYY